MFTGIIESMCPLVGLRRGATWRLSLELGDLAEGVKLGDSIAVNGVCLTVAALSGSRASFDAIGETIERMRLVVGRSLIPEFFRVLRGLYFFCFIFAFISVHLRINDMLY